MSKVYVLMFVLLNYLAICSAFSPVIVHDRPALHKAQTSMRMCNITHTFEKIRNITFPYSSIKS